MFYVSETPEGIYRKLEVVKQEWRQEFSDKGLTLPTMGVTCC